MLKTMMRQVVLVLKAGPMTVIELAMVLQWRKSQVRRILHRLALQGDVCKYGGGWRWISS